ncbi:MAG: dihydrofolate reductase [Candidatus Anstonellales archaeon]
MKLLSIIAAMSINGVIGKNNSIPWHIPEDLKFFKNKTVNHSVIMGRKTFESIGKPLQNRYNIIVSKSLKKCDGIYVADNLDDALDIAYKFDSNPFVIGGAELYKQTIELATDIYLTIVNKIVEGDTYFPEIDKEKWAIKDKIILNEISYVCYFVRNTVY